MMYWGGNDVGGWGYALMIISMVLFWGAIITGTVLLVRYASRGPQPPVEGQMPASAEDTLARRFAGGEISEEEYRAGITVLRERRPS